LWYSAEIVAVIRAADPIDKAEIYRGLNLVLTYQPGGDPAQPPGGQAQHPACDRQ
jgi:hypothetical protein